MFILFVNAICVNKLFVDWLIVLLIDWLIDWLIITYTSKHNNPGLYLTESSVTVTVINVT